MGAGLAVVPLMGLLESIAVAKSFGKLPPVPAPQGCPGLACLPSCLHLSSLVFNSLSFQSKERVLVCLNRVVGVRL